MCPSTDSDGCLPGNNLHQSVALEDETVVSARLGGPMSLTQSGSTSLGGKMGASNEKRGLASPDPVPIQSILIRLYAALAFFVAVVRGWFSFALVASFRVACAFSLAVNSCLTFAVIAATSTL
jgi:hypothetical protein